MKDMNGLELNVGDRVLTRHGLGTVHAVVKKDGPPYRTKAGLPRCPGCLRSPWVDDDDNPVDTVSVSLDRNPNGSMDGIRPMFVKKVP